MPCTSSSSIDRAKYCAPLGYSPARPCTRSPVVHRSVTRGFRWTRSDVSEELVVVGGVMGTQGSTGDVLEAKGKEIV